MLNKTHLQWFGAILYMFVYTFVFGRKNHNRQLESLQSSLDTELKSKNDLVNIFESLVLLFHNPRDFPRNLAGVCGTYSLKPLTPLRTKLFDFLYPYLDLAEKSMPYFRPGTSSVCLKNSRRALNSRCRFNRRGE